MIEANGPVQVSDLEMHMSYVCVGMNRLWHELGGEEHRGKDSMLSRRRHANPNKSIPTLFSSGWPEGENLSCREEALFVDQFPLVDRALLKTSKVEIL